MQDILNKINLLGSNTGIYLTPFEKVMEFIKIFVTFPMILPVVMVMLLFLAYGTRGKTTNNIKLPLFVAFIGLISCVFLYDKYTNVLALIFFSSFLFLLFYTILACMAFVSNMIEIKNKKKMLKERKEKEKTKKIKELSKEIKKIKKEIKPKKKAKKSIKTEKIKRAN